MSNTSANVDVLLATLSTNVGHFLSVFLGIVVFFMQCGFAFLEAGCTRSKNTTFILIKNVMTTAVSMMAYWLFGYAFAYGYGDKANDFIGAKHFASHDMSESMYGHFFFQFTMAATVTTIISGALSERCSIAAYVILSFFMSGFIYPTVTHWAWGGGWLSQGITYTSVGNVGYRDFAGSGVVHVLAGVSALIGCIILRPRHGRFFKDADMVVPMRGHSTPLAALGGFIIFFGILAFNGGAQFVVGRAGDGDRLGMSVANSVIAGTFSLFGTLFFNKIKMFRNTWTVLQTINGTLAGMVAASAGCSRMYPWGACVLGVFASISYCLWSALIKKLRVDDPLDVFAVHFGGGLWGVIAVAFLDMHDGILNAWNEKSGYVLAWQLCGVSAILGWSLFFSFFLFITIHAFGAFRVSRDAEEDGLDMEIHDEPAYPIEAYSHGNVEEMLRTLQNNPKMASQNFDNMAYDRRHDDVYPSRHSKPSNRLSSSMPPPKYNSQRRVPYHVYGANGNYHLSDM